MRLPMAALRTRQGPLGWVLLAPAWLLLGVLVVLYAVGLMVFGLLVVLAATLRLVLAPLLATRR